MSELTQQQKISQQQHLSARQQHSLKLLEIPILKLQQQIDTAMAFNPVIEYEYRANDNTFNELNNDSHDDFSNDDDYSTYDTDSWHDDLPIPDSTSQYTAEQQQKREYMLSSLREEQSMQHKLLLEIADADFSTKEREIAETIIMAVNERGYIDIPLADIAQSCNAELFETEEVLKKVQKLLPPGIGARDLRECLQIQLEAAGLFDRTAELLMANLSELLMANLSELQSGKYAKLSKKLDIPEAQIIDFKNKLQNLNPYPGYALSSENAQIIIPELEITVDGDDYILKSNDEFLPRIKISSQYQQMLDCAETDSETRKYLKEKIAEAEQLCTALDMREKTIVRIGRFIIANQLDYLNDGAEFLRPMTMAQAAEALNLHESTVSRACANKYLGTPHGIQPFKYFFAGSFSSRDGENFSARAIEERIKIYIRDEDPDSPLSDEKIANLLYAEGFDIARRTVAKYRKKLNIPPTSKRRQRI